MSAVQRGVSHLPGKSSPRKKVGKPFDVKAWHKRKAAEAQARAKRERQVETCYKQHVPPQVKYAPVELTRKQENIAALMRQNRAVGL